jgi:hypothetical protein
VPQILPFVCFERQTAVASKHATALTSETLGIKRSLVLELSLQVVDGIHTQKLERAFLVQASKQ